jgi:predicted P-loop ATPase
MSKSLSRDETAQKHGTKSQKGGRRPSDNLLKKSKTNQLKAMQDNVHPNKRSKQSGHKHLHSSGDYEVLRGLDPPVRVFNSREAINRT